MFRRKTPKPQQIPQLVVRDAEGQELSRYLLTEDEYLLGRDAEVCQIVVPSQLVGSKNILLQKDKLQKKRFIIRDLDSTNGLYRGKRKIKNAELHHGDRLTLGNPEIPGIPSITFENPYTTRQKILRAGLLGIGGLLGLGVLMLGIETNKIDASASKLPTTRGRVSLYANNTLQGRPLHEAKGTVYGNISDLSYWIRAGILAKEDQRFYWHVGVDPVSFPGIILSKGQRGGSTVSQQIAATLFKRYMFTGYGDKENIKLPAGVTESQYIATQEQKYRDRNSSIWERTLPKIRQMVVGLKVDAAHSKDFLLLSYMNKVYLNDNEFGGFESAAQRYFGKSANKLELAQSAVLVGMLPNPWNYSPCAENRSRKKTEPVKEPRSARIQQLIVLRKMLSAGMVNDQQVKAATGWDGIRNLSDDAIEAKVLQEKNIAEKIFLKPEACKASSPDDRENIYRYVLRELEDLKGVLGSKIDTTKDLAIETSLDLRMQEKAEAILKRNIENVGDKKGFSQGAVVTLDSQSGLIKALVGGVPPDGIRINRAARSELQTGSTFKLFTYAAALQNKIPETKTYSCDPLNWDGYKIPGCKHATGKIDMRTGFALSENPVALRIAQEVGLDKIVQTANSMRVDSLNSGPAMVLGASKKQNTVLEMTGAYGTIAAQGKWHKPHSVLRIYDLTNCRDKVQVKTCPLIYDASKDLPYAPEQAIEPKIAETMTTLMTGVVTMPNGTGKDASIPGLTVAGKTGTTDKYKDLWFIGFVVGKPEVTGVWLGNDKPRPTTGSSADAARVWSSYMGDILKPAIPQTPAK